MKIIQENEYLDTMKNEVEPYLKAHCRDGYIPGAEDIYHEKNGIIGKIHVKRYLADDPKGVVVISHGFTEGAPKYEEMIYYFLQAGYHVYMPEHMGHGQSYRLTADPSLVYIDIWKRQYLGFIIKCYHSHNCIWSCAFPCQTKCSFRSCNLKNHICSSMLTVSQRKLLAFFW